MRFATRIVLELPECLDPETVYLVGDAGLYSQAALLCPCECGDWVQLNLAPPGPPLWRVSPDPDGTVTISPSIERSIRCRSHFWIWAGKLIWAHSIQSGSSNVGTVPLSSAALR
jgi:hypothetical protein